MRDYFALLERKRDLIRLRNRSKLVQRSLFAIIDFVLYMACEGMILTKKLTFFSFHFMHLIFFHVTP